MFVSTDIPRLYAHVDIVRGQQMYVRIQYIHTYRGICAAPKSQVWSLTVVYYSAAMAKAR